MSRNRSRNKPRQTLEQQLEAVHLAFAPIAYAFERFASQLLDRLDQIIEPQNALAPGPGTCRVSELSVDHLGCWIIVGSSPSPHDATAGRLVGLRPGTDRSAGPTTTRVLVLQQGAAQTNLEIGSNIIALVAPRAWK